MCICEIIQSFLAFIRAASIVHVALYKTLIIHCPKVRRRVEELNKTKIVIVIVIVMNTDLLQLQSRHIPCQSSPALLRDIYSRSKQTASNCNLLNK